MKIKFVKNKYLLKNENGIAILFAILITTALTLISIGISQIAFKELLFSIEARDSNLALMAADTGIECAMYMDSMQAFTSSSTGITGDSYKCHGFFVNASTYDSVNFSFSLPVSVSSCVQVYINKQAGTSGSSTQIDSYGYNAPQKDSQDCIDVTSVNPKLVSRALRIVYPN